MNDTPLRFDSDRLHRQPPSGLLTVETTLAHFAIITYLVDPAALRPHVHPRFELESIQLADGEPKALISVVPFLDLDFRFVRLPWPKWKFGQTNYRAYVRDTLTNEHVAWFFGTSLDSITVNVPRHLWKIPWHRGKIRFDVEYDESEQRYARYQMSTKSKWAPAEVQLEDSGQVCDGLVGFPDLEEGLVLLTHPVLGYYHRRDSRLGTYSIWHDRLNLTTGRALSASFPLLDRLGLVEDGDLKSIHSVLIQRSTDFTIYLPPKAVE
jgi:hypothetical protein